MRETLILKDNPTVKIELEITKVTDDEILIREITEWKDLGGETSTTSFLILPKRKIESFIGKLLKVYKSEGS